MEEYLNDSFLVNEVEDGRLWPPYEIFVFYVKMLTIGGKNDII